MSKNTQYSGSRVRLFLLSLGMLSLFVGFELLGGMTGYGTPALANPGPKEIQQKILAGQEALYSGEFDKASNIFTALIEVYPADPKGYFFLALTYRWLTRVDPTSKTYQRQFEKKIKKAISVAESLHEKDKNSVEALLYLAASYGYRAEYYNFLKQEWSKAYDDGVKMRKYLGKAEKFSQTTIDVQLGYGLYNYYAYLYREKIGWWRFLLSLPRGDKEKGIKLLETVHQKGIYTRIEAWYFLIIIYKDDADKELRQKAIALSEALHRKYPNHPYFHILLAGIYHKYHDRENAIRVSRDVIKHAPGNAYYSDSIVYQAKYVIAESRFYMGKYDEALQGFNEIIASQQQHPPYLLPWSHLRRGTIYNLIGEKEKAAAEYNLVLEMEDVLNVHELAKGLLKNYQRKK